MSRICLNRTGALGDVLEVLPIADRLVLEGHTVMVKTNYPQIFIGTRTLCVSPNFNDYDKYFDLNMAFERDHRKFHPIDSYSKIVFGDTKTPHRITYNFRPHKSLTVNGEPLTRPFAVLHPARSWPIRTLPKHFWQDLIHELNEIDLVVIITGTSQDWDGLSNCVDLRDKLTLPEQASLIDLANVFVCSESGPMILAQATTTPIVALLTMIVPEHIIHDDAYVFTINAKVPCVGCALRQPTITTYFDCINDHNITPRRCVESFDPKNVALFVQNIVFNDEPMEDLQ